MNLLDDFFESGNAMIASGPFSAGHQLWLGM